MNLLDFVQKFPDEDSCKLKFKAYREQLGVICANCGKTTHYWKRDKSGENASCAVLVPPLVNSLIDSHASIASDKSNSYVDLHGFVAHHQADIIPSGKVGEKLPWVHIGISNVKRVLLNIYRDLCKTV